MCKLLETRRFDFFAVQFQKQEIRSPLSENLFSDFRTREFQKQEMRSPLSENFAFRFQNRGTQKAHRAVPNEALYGDLRISELIIPTYLFSIGYGKRLSQEPPNVYVRLFHDVRTFFSTIG